MPSLLRSNRQPTGFPSTPSTLLFLTFATCLLACAADPLAGREEVPVIQGIGNDYGFREHRPGKWSFIYPEIRNPTAVEQELEVVAFFALTQQRKFAKQVIVPPRSTLRVSLPIQVPSLDRIPLRESTGRPMEIIRLQLHLYDLAGSEPKLLLDDGKRSYETDIGIRGVAFGERGENYQASAMLEPAIESTAPSQQLAEDWVTTARLQFNQVGRVGQSRSPHLPESMLAFESVDQLVIDNDHLLDDIAGLRTVRRWLARGGHVWIMLDLVSEETVRRLLGDATPFQLIERTSWNTIQIKDADPFSQAAEPEPRFFEQPVDFARVVLTAGELVHELDGWPASFWIRSGQGKVHFTTVGARAWIRDFDPSRDRTPDVRLGIASYALTEPMQNLAYDMYAAEASNPGLDYQAVKTHLINQIGYRVLPRSTVISVFVIYTLALTICGIVLAATGQLDKLILVGPLLAILAGLVFLGSGYFSRRSAEPAVAAFQMVEPIPAADELRVDGLAVLYSDEPLDFQIAASRQGVLREDREIGQTEEQKIVWDQTGQWKIPTGAIEPGLAAYRIRSNVPNPQPIEATARFTAQGLEGEISTAVETGQLEDLVLALPNSQFLSVQLEDRRFTVDAADLLAPGEFVRSNLLTDKQRWHQSIYRSLYPTASTDRQVTEPTLLGWSPPMPMDIAFPESFARVGGALIRIPLVIRKTPIGDPVEIPGPMIAIENVLNARNAISGSFDDRTGKWVGSIAEQSSVRLRFQIPQSVLPLDLERVTLKIESIQGLNRTIEFRTVLGEPQVIQQLKNPNGPFETSVTDPSLLKLDDRGGFLIDVNITVDPDFYEQQRRRAAGEDRNADGTGKEMELTREKLEGISLQVAGTTSRQTD